MSHITWFQSVIVGSIVLFIALFLNNSDLISHLTRKTKIIESLIVNFGQEQYLTLFNTLVPSPSFNDSIRWGTFQAGMYFGIRSRTHPYHVNAGLLWTCSEKRCSDLLRHWSQQDDRLRKYGWLHHDGRTFGYQKIEDQFGKYNLQTQYVNLLSTVKQDRLMHLFSNQFKLESRDRSFTRKSKYVSLFYYIDLSCGDDGLSHACRDALLRSDKNIFEIENNKATKCITNEKNEECLYQHMTTSTSKSSTNDALRQTFPSTFSARVEARVNNRIGSVKSFDLRFQGFAGANVVLVKEKIATQRISSAAFHNKEDIENEDDLIEWETRMEEEQSAIIDNADLIYLDNTIESKSLLVVFQVFVELANENAILEEDDVVMDVVFMEKKLENDEERDEDNTKSISKEQVKEWQQRLKSTNSIKSTLVKAADVKRSVFERQFESTFQLSNENEWNTSHLQFAKAAFSNLIGGLSYFYGSAVIKTLDGEDRTIGTRTSKPMALFSATPSRSFFPRGFLWDEGFHQLGILPFDPEITEQVILHWLGAMLESGYIPREMILGRVASARVPEEFLVQNPTHANPPSFLLCLEKYLNMKNVSKEKRKAFMQRTFPSLNTWYEWFLASQQVSHVVKDDNQQMDSPEIKMHATAPRTEEAKLSRERILHGFQWRGRDPLDDRLNPITLASGFDDYPRASSPSKEELHVDLLCWMIRFSSIMARIAKFIGQKDGVVQKFVHQEVKFMETLNIVHWNDSLQTYSDIGMHSTDGVVTKMRVARCRDENGQVIDVLESESLCPTSHPDFLFYLGDGHGGFETRYVYVPGVHVHHIGYVSIFPLILRILPADAPQLEALLLSIRDPAHLWTPYGIRSLSTRDPFFEVGNRPNDKPYWRGAIWININYLALDALMYYSKQDGPYQQALKDTYTELRQNVITNIHSEYLRTGYFWEQYNGNLRLKKSFGRGRRSHPFTGWTALIANIMAEVYIHNER